MGADTGTLILSAAVIILDFATAKGPSPIGRKPEAQAQAQAQAQHKQQEAQAASAACISRTTLPLSSRRSLSFTHRPIPSICSARCLPASLPLVVLLSSTSRPANHRMPKLCCATPLIIVASWHHRGRSHPSHRCVLPTACVCARQPGDFGNAAPKRPSAASHPARWPGVPCTRPPRLRSPDRSTAWEIR